jgi:hypothetical protein
MELLETAEAKRVRAARNGWHYLFVLICVAVFFPLYGAIRLPFYLVRHILVPSDAFLSGGTSFGNFLFGGLPAYPALAFAMILGRFLVRLIPSTRAALESELSDDSYTTSCLNKFAKSGLLSLTVVLPLCLTAAMSFWSLSPTRIDVRPIFSLTTHSYDWSKITEIKTGCRTVKTTKYDFVLKLADGTHVDLMKDDPWSFVAAYPQVQSALEGQSYKFDNAAFVGSSCGTYPRRSWREILTRPPTDNHSAKIF